MNERKHHLYAFLKAKFWICSIGEFHDEPAAAIEKSKKELCETKIKKQF